jgi:hypothetical protein
MFESSSQYIEGEPRMIADYEFHDDKIIVNDPVWGRHEIGNQPGDEIFLDLVDNDLVRRSLGVEQLSLDPLTATIPGSANFSRWEHMWGSTVFVRSMTEGSDMEPHDRLVLQLRTFLADLGHTAYSHIGDWLSQGNGGSEDEHDRELPYLLEISGINDILCGHDINPAEVAPEQADDWIECPAPDLCVDRVDYAAREIKRWLGADANGHQVLRPESFSLTDDEQLVMKDQQTAKSFAKAFLVLGTEHWAEPTHRLQLACQQSLIKRVLSHEYTGLLAANMGSLGAYHPRDLLYTIDSDITREMFFRDDFLNVLRPIMEQIGQAKRRLFLWERKEELQSYMRESNGIFPDPLEHYSDFTHRLGNLPLTPSAVSMVPVTRAEDLADFQTNPYSVDFFLPALKPRNIDPLFQDDNGALCRLSEVDTEFRSLATQQAEVQSRAYVGRLLVNTETKHVLERGIIESEKGWHAALSRPRIGTEDFRRILADAALQTVANPNMAIIRWER